MTSAALTPDFYRAFEDKHRGTRQLIKARLSVYLPFILPLAEQHPKFGVLDLGCGRGEWLELLRESKVNAEGIDLDDGMLAACRELGLNARQGNAIEYLQSLKDHSLLAITGFHIAEHLPFPVLQTLFAEARRVLIPCGLLILETPNPENLVVGTASFYIDPTHQRPLPAQLLTFLAEHNHFSRIKLLRLQEEPHLATGHSVGLYDVLANASPDYAIIAQPDTTQPEVTNSAYEANYGLSLHALASQYDHNILTRLNHQSETIRAVQAQAEEALTLAQELRTVYTSRSWRITRPLRWLAQRCRSQKK